MATDMTQVLFSTIYWSVQYQKLIHMINIIEYAGSHIEYFILFLHYGENDDWMGDSRQFWPVGLTG